MEILKENIITVEDFKAEIEKTKFEVQKKMCLLIITTINYLLNGR